MYRFLEKVPKGQTISGKVVKLKNRFNNIYVIELYLKAIGVWESNQLITAQSKRELTIGSLVEFEVDIINNRPTLRIKEKKVAISKEERILRGCSLPITDQNIGLIKEYLKTGKPVQLDMILQFFRKRDGI